MASDAKLGGTSAPPQAATATGAPPKVKGISFLGVLGSIHRTLGTAVLDETLKVLPHEIAKLARANGYYVNLWYPLADFRELHAAVQRVTGRGPELARELGYDASLSNFRGVYRVLLGVLSADFLINRSPGIFRRFYDTGTVEIVHPGRHQVEARFSGCTGFDRNIWEALSGGCIALLEACGAKDVQLTSAAGGRDRDDHLTARASWR
jgi:hypothetical protein